MAHPYRVPSPPPPEPPAPKPPRSYRAFAVSAVMFATQIVYELMRYYLRDGRL